MESQLIISALIRLVSIQYVFGALLSCSSLPAHISMLASSMPDNVKGAGRDGLLSDATNIGFSLIVAIFLWIYAGRIATFVLKSLGKEKNG